MVNYDIPRGGIGSPTFAITAGQVSTVSFAEDLDYVEVVSDGAAAVWWTCDGSTPAEGVGYFIPAVMATDERRPALTDDRLPGAVVVRLWSAGSPVVRVQRG